jgi:hypothetical protein
VKFCRLRYRVKNHGDAATVQDQVFSVAGGLATPVKLPRGADANEMNSVKQPEE